MNKNTSKRNFVFLAVGSLVSGIGDYLYSMGLTVALYSISGSIESIAYMWLVRGIVRIPVQYFAGMLADRYNKKILILIANIASAPVAFLLFYDHLHVAWLAYFVPFCLQALNDIELTAGQALLPQIVQKDLLPQYNSYISLINTIVRFVSPAIAGLCIVTLGVRALFIINSISFLLAALFLYFIKYDFTRSGLTEWKRGAFGQSLEGARVLKKYASVTAMFLTMGFYAVLGRFYEVYKISVSDLHLGMGETGIVSFSYALAIGSLFAPVMVRFARARQKEINDLFMFFISSIAISISYLFFGTTTNGVIALVALGVIGVAESLQRVFSSTLIQKEIPEEYLGRTFAFYKILLTTFGLLAVGFSPLLFNVFGQGKVFAFFSLLATCVTLGFLVYKFGNVVSRSLGRSVDVKDQSDDI